MNLRRTFTLGIFAAMMLVSLPGMAQQTKFGFVDLQRAVSESREGKAALQRLQEMTERKQRELDTRQDELKRMEEEIRTQGNMWNDEMKRTKLAEYQRKGLELQEFYAQNAKELSEREQELTAPLLERFMKIIKKIGTDRGYTAIFHSGGAIFVNNAVDLTAEVIRLFDAGGGR